MPTIWMTSISRALLAVMAVVAYSRLPAGNEVEYAAPDVKIAKSRRAVSQTNDTHACKAKDARENAVRRVEVMKTTGESADHDPSIIVDEDSVVDPHVENGTAYDRSVLVLMAARKVILPDTTILRRGGEGDTVQLFMAKRLRFRGHPPEPLNVQGARVNMGCAVRSEEDSIVIATYGEWGSKEGGADMRVIAIVPNGVAVEQRTGLSGPHSDGQDRRGQNLADPRNTKNGYWYGPASPAMEWSAVLAEPHLSWAEAKWPDAGRGDAADSK